MHMTLRLSDVISHTVLTNRIPLIIEFNLSLPCFCLQLAIEMIIIPV